MFQSLDCLNISRGTHEFACIWIRVCCILYNVLRPHLDDEDLQPLQRNLNVVGDKDDEGLLDSEDKAEAKRIALHDILFNENN